MTKLNALDLVAELIAKYPRITDHNIIKDSSATITYAGLGFSINGEGFAINNAEPNNTSSTGKKKIRAIELGIRLYSNIDRLSLNLVLTFNNFVANVKRKVNPAITINGTSRDIKNAREILFSTLMLLKTGSPIISILIKNFNPNKKYNKEIKFLCSACIILEKAAVGDSIIVPIVFQRSILTTRSLRYDRQLLHM